MANVTLDGRGLGWKRDLPDGRDHRYATPREVLTALPPAYDLRPGMPPVVDQGNIGSCTANSASYLFDFERRRSGRPPLGPSRLFQYWNTRFLEGTVESDSGASIRNTIKAMVDYGACPEPLWPYVTARFRERPPDACYAAGERQQVIEYLRVNQSATEIMGAIASGHPVCYGMLIFRQFESVGRDGIIRMPSPSEQPLGGHSGVLCRYYTDNSGNVWGTDQNTWSTGHGDGGFCHLPMAYLTNPALCDDFWVIRAIESDEVVPPVPIPPAPDFYVGPGVQELMRRIGDGDRGGAIEWYPKDKDGNAIGWSLVPGQKPRLYLYVASTRMVMAIDADHYFVED